MQTIGQPGSAHRTAREGRKPTDGHLREPTRTGEHSASGAGQGESDLSAVITRDRRTGGILNRDYGLCRKSLARRARRRLLGERELRWRRRRDGERCCICGGENGVRDSVEHVASRRAHCAIGEGRNATNRGYGGACQGAGARSLRKRHLRGVVTGDHRGTCILNLDRQWRQSHPNSPRGRLPRKGELCSCNRRVIALAHNPGEPHRRK